MKSNLFRVSMIAAIAATAAWAQNVDPLKANVPFNFIVNGKKVQGGEVTVERSFISGVLTISTNGRAGAAVISTALQSPTPPGKARLVFHRYGDTYFLAEVWDAGDYGRKLPETSRERELSAKGPAEAKTIALSIR
jgi:hypothetical protein